MRNALYFMTEETSVDALEIIDTIPYARIVYALVAALVCLAIVLLFKSHFVKILFGCAFFIFLWMATKHAFGSNSLVTQIMCWVTAAAVCALTIAIVNRIDWTKLRGKRGS
jgi:D-alanyl-lipoteichoic acid acyltransferase DltB (MBOAT superfamily)